MSLITYAPNPSGINRDKNPASVAELKKYAQVRHCNRRWCTDREFTNFGRYNRDRRQPEFPDGSALWRGASFFARLLMADKKAVQCRFGESQLTSIAKLIIILRDGDDGRLPSAARAALLEMPEQIEMLTARIEALDAKIAAAMKADEMARRLMTIPGVGPIIAATVRATIQDPAAFRTGRDLAAWIGITPQANSSGGKERLGRISKRGNKQLRTLLIVGATSILKLAKRGVKLPPWLISLMERRPYKVAAVALANKMARTIWALLVKGGTYEAPTIMARA